MHLEGSCHCGAVSFSVEAGEPVPFMRCYCGICRKTAGGGGCAINLGADYRTLKVKGREHLSIYRVRLDRTEYGKDEPGARRKKSKVDRAFCSRCGSGLWVYSPHYPELVHPFASAIDTPLPKAPETNHILRDYAPDWIDVPRGKHHHHFPRYPDESLAAWHERHGLQDS